MFQDTSKMNGMKLKDKCFLDNGQLWYLGGAEKRMNNKGQIGIGTLLVVFISVIVAVTLFITISQNIGSVTDTYTATAAQYTPAADGVSIDLTGQELISVSSLVNESGTHDCEDNFTVAEGVSPRTGTKRILMTTPSGNDESYCTYVNISYEYGPEGYIDDSGGRAIALIIPLLAALGIAVITLFPSLRSEILGIGK